MLLEAQNTPDGIPASLVEKKMKELQEKVSLTYAKIISIKFEMETLRIQNLLCIQYFVLALQYCFYSLKRSAV